MNCFKLLNRLNIQIHPSRCYRFGRRVDVKGFYVSPQWFDQKVLKNDAAEQPKHFLNLDGVIRAKNRIFDAEKDRQKSLITRMEKIEINLEKPFPDGEDYVLIMNANLSTPYDCAAHIHQILRERSALALVDEQHYWDMHRPLQQSCFLKLLHFKHETHSMPVNQAFWRSCSMLLASVLPHAFKSEYSVEIISLPMSELRGGSFVCDVNIKNLPDWQPTSHDLQSITSLLWDETTKGNVYERLEVNESIAQQLFSDSAHRLRRIESTMKQNANRTTFTVYRVGQHIELSDGPMISNTRQIGSIYLTAIHPLKTSDGSRFYRFQGIAMPKQLHVNSFAFSLIRDRAKKLNTHGIQSV